MAEKMDEGATATAEGRSFTQRELLLRALELDPRSARAFADLGAVCAGETVVVNEMPFSEKDLYIKAIQLDPNLRLAYENLIEVLEPGEHITVGDTSYDKRALLAKANSIQPDDEPEEKPASSSLWDALAGDVQNHTLASHFLPSLKQKVRSISEEESPEKSGKMWDEVATDITTGVGLMASKREVSIKNLSSEDILALRNREKDVHERARTHGEHSLAVSDALLSLADHLFAISQTEGT